MASTVYYNRCVVWAAVQVEAVRNALKAKPDGRITGEDVKKGFEKIASFTLGGLVPPLKITPNDHEGGGLVQIYQVKGGQFAKVTDWFSAYNDVVGKHIRRRARRSSRRHARRPQSRRRLRRMAMQRHVGIFMTVV